MSLLSDAKAKIAKLLINSDRFDQIMNGDVNTDVTVDGGTIPSLRKLFDYIVANVVGVKIIGTVATVANLPSSGNKVGDIYIVTTAGAQNAANDGYVWAGSQWRNIGQIRGPKGDQGIAGNQGAPGVVQSVNNKSAANITLNAADVNAAGLGVDVNFRDITADRGDGKAAIYLGGSGNRYVYYDGLNYMMPGAELYVNNGKVWTTQTVTPLDKNVGGKVTAEFNVAGLTSFGRTRDDPSSFWVNDYLPGSFGSNKTGMFVIATNLNHYSTMVSAQRTSYKTDVQDWMSTDTSLLVHDNTTISHACWARYTQVNITPGAKISLTLCEEISIENRNALPIKMDPFSNFGVGGLDIAAMRVNVIGYPADTSKTYYPISSYIEFNWNGQQALNGITFEQESIRDNITGQKDTIVMGVKHGFTWYAGAGSVAWRIFSNSQKANSGQLVLSQDRFDWYLGNSNFNVLRGSLDWLATDALFICSELQIGNLPTSNPGVPGRVWRNGNQLMISTG